MFVTWAHLSRTEVPAAPDKSVVVFVASPAFDASFCGSFHLPVGDERMDIGDNNLMAGFEDNSTQIREV